MLRLQGGGPGFGEGCVVRFVRLSGSRGRGLGLELGRGAAPDVGHGFVAFRDS